ncbi:GH3 auxin-responsive promoter family protein [Persicobacter sp. CCB-QB2]|uniref:GH3 auxin-responsive promoter family protein n=1 Tax=Persicobacter sp. CCB-QB2 TaxID=1561025 RepID=UPI0006A9FBC1|nr:GH3 auxin-responsive promoter family protein [Persicobacter sp. CCB-QB2]
MGLLSFFSKYVAAYTVKKQNQWASRPIESQHTVFMDLLEGAKNTVFGKDHGFEEIVTYEDFKARVPIRDYEDLRPYIDRVVAGEKDILWKGKPVYFAKTSGTTSGAKYIPLTKESIPNHINGARNMLLNYMHETGNYDFVSRKLIFLSGSPTLEKKNGIFTGRLSGIVNHHVPEYLRRNQLPSYETNCIEDWETKLDKIVEETTPEDMSLISGIPPWVQMYFDRLQEKHGGKKIKDIFPNFSVFVWGGVNFEPYRTKLYQSIGKKVDTLETYPASEGFFAYQDSQTAEGLLLNVKSGIFFEFIPSEEYFNENPTRLSIGEVELGVNYALIVNNNAGLWGYSIGDTVKFVSKKPYRVIVTGRIKHFISAFGEHVIGEEVEKAMKAAIDQYPETELREFTVAPNVSQDEGQSSHQWFIDFAQKPADMPAFAKVLDEKLQQLNVYYQDLIVGNILRPLEIVSLKEGAFQEYMKSEGKLGGQNKVPRLSNDRKIADALMAYALEG